MDVWMIKMIKSQFTHYLRKREENMNALRLRATVLQKFDVSTGEKVRHRTNVFPLLIFILKSLATIDFPSLEFYTCYKVKKRNWDFFYKNTTSALNNINCELNKFKC